MGLHIQFIRDAVTDWPKYTAFALLALFFGAMIFDAIKAARKEGGSRKSILLRVLLWLLIFAAVIALNAWINRDWSPGCWLITISPF